MLLLDKNNPKDWDDAMKIISNNKLLKYMSKSITVSEMDGVAIECINLIVKEASCYLKL